MWAGRRKLLRPLTSNSSILTLNSRATPQALEQAVDVQTEALETVSLKPTKANIAIEHFSLAWAPFWHDEKGQATPGW